MIAIKRTLALLAALFLLPLVRTAASGPEGSITVRMRWGGQAVPGGSITLYRVAVPGPDGRYIPEPAFSDCGMDPNAVGSPGDAERLGAYALEKRLPGQTEALGLEGTTVFSPLADGLYLLVQGEAGSGYLPARPFLVQIPHRVGEHACNHVDASPKCAPEPLSPGIPQTGQLRWPVPVLTALGLFCLAGGLLLRRKGPDA